MGRFDYCDGCVNTEIPYECRRCKDGDRFEATDLVAELSVHELRFMTVQTEDDE